MEENVEYISDYDIVATLWFEPNKKQQYSTYYESVLRIFKGHPKSKKKVQIHVVPKEA